MTNAPSTYLVDSNVFVYAVDAADRRKQRVANLVLDLLGTANRGSLSAQVLGESFNTITRRIARPVPATQAADALNSLSQALVIYPITAWTVQEAFRGVERHQMSYWDALIWATAKLNDLSRVLTEDIQSNGDVEGISFVNPFAPGFDVSSL